MSKVRAGITVFVLVVVLLALSASLKGYRGVASVTPNPSLKRRRAPAGSVSLGRSL